MSKKEIEIRSGQEVEIIKLTEDPMIWVEFPYVRDVRKQHLCVLEEKWKVGSEGRSFF